MGIFTGIFSGGVKGVLDGASDIIGKFVEDPNKRAELTQQLATLQATHEEAMEKIAEEKYEAALKDTADARARETAIATSKDAPLLNKIATPVIGFFVTFGFFGLLAYMLKYDVPPGNRDILNIMLGSLGTAWISIVSYYYGSSSGSRDKDDTIKKLAS